MEDSMNDKGKFMGECARMACNRRPADRYNFSTRLYYCLRCAKLIQQHADAEIFQLNEENHDHETRPD